MVKKALIGFAAVAALAPATAFGSASDGAAAALTTTQDEVAAHSADAGDDITCQAQADGGAVTPETNFFVGKIFAQDVGVGQGKCVSLTAKSYTMRLQTKIQWFDGAYWRDVPGCASATTSTAAVQGVAVNPAQTVTCNFGDASPYLDKYHRASVTLWNSVDGRPRGDVSAIWFQRRG